jgi:hypothetical protein
MPKAETNVIDFTAARNARHAGTAILSNPAGIDGEFVWRCEELIAITELIQDAADDAADDRALRVALEPLNRAYKDHQHQMALLPLPSTGDGARAAARMMVAYCDMSGEAGDDGEKDGAWSNELWALLCRACARYLAGPGSSLCPQS